MVKITEQTTLEEINNLPEFAQARDQLIGGGAEWFRGEAGNDTLAELNKKHPTWALADMIYGLENLQRISATGRQYVYYPNESKPKVSLFYLPAEKKACDHYMILNAGGAYGAVCTMVEALPVAARLNALGMDCFCLNYTVVTPEQFTQGLMPEPMVDMANAWNFIHLHEKEFGLKAYEYFVGGFSAGGHLCAAWGTKNTGARHYQVPQPRGLMLVYPLVSVDSVADEGVRLFMKTGMFGADKMAEAGPEYEIHQHVDEYYPPTYLIQSRDDDTVPIVNSVLLENALKAAGVTGLFERPQTGGHGFGLGTIAPGSKWVERALAFLEENNHVGF